MATIKFYLDKRTKRKDKTSPLKLSINHNSKTALLSLKIYLLPEHWNDQLEKITTHPRKAFLNNYINLLRLDVSTFILELTKSVNIGEMTASNLREAILKNVISKPCKDTVEEQIDLFYFRFNNFIETKKGRTKEIYEYTFGKIKQFDSNFKVLRFEDVNKNWLSRFDLFLSETSSKNTRNIHLRNIRAVFNDAIDDELTTFYPFRKFKIKKIETAKRSLSVDDLRMFFDYNVQKHQVQYLDIFKLIFYLIGINIKDLCYLKEAKKGRLEYNRSKTKKLYSIKVEPEAKLIIEKYKGKDYLLNILDRYKNYRDYAKRLNENLQKIGDYKRVGRSGKKIYTPLFPDITTYWARHTWATIASELDIPKETIAAALGHSIGNPVTSIYIDFNMKKIDIANRAVIDYVNK